MLTCIYCNSVEIKEREIVRNEFAWAIPTNIPVVPGHTLILPIRCIAKYEDLTPIEKEAIEEIRIKLKSSLTKVFGAQGFNYAWNEEKIAGQSIPHFHLHMLPRKSGDEGITEYEPRKFLYRPGSRENSPELELKSIAELIKSAL